ncbi:hypothetical protein GCM10027403_22800 [Arthrobacter tecti]
MSASDFYTGIVPDVYSALRGTTFDAGRYLEFVRQTGQPALELGCGDDGPFLELVRQSIDIEGVDSSQDMLNRCNARAEAQNLHIVTYCQAMEDLALPRTYRAIYLAGPTFNLLPDDDAAYRALKGIAGHLAPGGVAMVPLWIPNRTPEQEFNQTRQATTYAGSIARYTVESEDYDETRRTRTTRTVYELRHGQQVERVRRDWIIHWHTPTGFADLAHAAGLEVIRADPLVDGEFTVYLSVYSEAGRPVTTLATDRPGIVRF